MIEMLVCIRVKKPVFSSVVAWFLNWGSNMPENGWVEPTLQSQRFGFCFSIKRLRLLNVGYLWSQNQTDFMFILCSFLFLTCYINDYLSSSSEKCMCESTPTWSHSPKCCIKGELVTKKMSLSGCECVCGCMSLCCPAKFYLPCFCPTVATYYTLRFSRSFY